MIFHKEISGRTFYWGERLRGFVPGNFLGYFSQLNFREEYLGGMSGKTAQGGQDDESLHVVIVIWVILVNTQTDRQDIF